MTRNYPCYIELFSILYAQISEQHQTNNNKEYYKKERNQAALIKFFQCALTPFELYETHMLICTRIVKICTEYMQFFATRTSLVFYET